MSGACGGPEAGVNDPATGAGIGGGRGRMRARTHRGPGAASSVTIPDMNDTPPARPPSGRSLADLTDPKAVLFDLDGTLVDTVPLRVQCWVEAFRDFGIAVGPTKLPTYMGSDGRWLAREMARIAGREIDWEQSDALDRAAGENFDRL